MDLPDLHDWKIKAVQTDNDDNSVTIDMFSPAGDVGRIILSEVKGFHLSGMMMQNVILDMIVFTSVVESNYFSYCKEVLHLKNNAFTKHSRLKVFYLEPSVGAEIACSCERIEFILPDNI